ncbi:MAG: 3-phosphoshikimate 1-carboxyvinyltransferase [Pseudomonadota bacterium]
MVATLCSSPVGAPLSGAVRLPGDKSVSHRSLMFGAIADGTTRIQGLLEGEDCLATRDAMHAMGVNIERHEAGAYSVHGVGMHGLNAPSSPIDLGNSGTAMRLLCGLLAAQPFPSALVGDASLSTRPMRRITEPLGLMGARVTTVDGHAPLSVSASEALHGLHYDMPIASAQLKSALLIAGLYASEPIRLAEPGPSRDHTERMLQAMGVDIEYGNGRVLMRPPERLLAIDIEVPADLSSAAFFLVAGTVVPGSALTLPGVGLNPTRDGVLSVLARMGATISPSAHRECGAEPVADLRVGASTLQARSFGPDVVPLAIDEFPVLFIAAALADGCTSFTGLEELRHKESDRIGVMTTAMRSLGVQLEEGEDWVRITGGAIHGGRIDSHGDHRVAMAFAVAGTMAKAPIIIENADKIATSFPNFVDLANSCGMDLRPHYD